MRQLARLAASVILLGLAATSLACPKASGTQSGGPRSPGPALAEDSLFARVPVLTSLPTSTAALLLVEKADVLSASPAGTGSGHIDLSWLAAPLPTIGASGLGAWLADKAVSASLAPDAPAGLAWLDVPSQTAVCFVRVADRARLRAQMQRLSQRDSGAWQLARSPRPQGAKNDVERDAEIVSAAQSGVAVVLRGDWMFIVSSAVPSVREATEVRLAGRPAPGTGLLDTPHFRRAAAASSARGFSGEGVVYLDMSALARRAFDRIDDLEYAVTAVAEEAEQTLRDARKRGVTPLEERALSDQALRLRKQARATHGQTALERQLIEQLWAGFGQVSGAFSVAGQRVDIRFAVTPVPETLAGRLVAARPGSDIDAGLGNAGGHGTGQGTGQGHGPPNWELLAYTAPSAVWQAAALAAGTLWVVPLEAMHRELASVTERQVKAPPLDLLATLGIQLSPATGAATLTLPFRPRSQPGARSLLAALAQKFGQYKGTAGTAPELPAQVEFAAPSARFTVALAPGKWTVTVQPHDDSSDSVTPGPSIAPLPADENPDVPLSEAYRALVAEHAGIGDRVAERQAALRNELSALRERTLVALGPVRATVQQSGVHFVGAAGLTMTATGPAALLRTWRDTAEAQVRARAAAAADIAKLVARAAAIGPELLRVRARDVQAWDLRPGDGSGDGSRVGP